MSALFNICHYTPRLCPFIRACAAAIVAGAAALPAVAFAQAPIPGFLNPHTGAFQPHFVVTAPSATTAIYTGTFELTLTITLASSIPTNQAIVCYVEADGSDSVGHYLLQSVSVAATRSGDKATCVVSVPYSWPLGASPVYATSYNVSTTASAGVPARSLSLYGVPATKLPADGTVTKITVNALI